MSDDDLNPTDLLAALNSRADLLARCIVYGLTEPYPATGSTLMLAIGQNVVTALAAEDCPDKGPERAARWATNFRVPPEIAVMVHAALSLIRPNGFDDLEERLRPILS